MKLVIEAKDVGLEIDLNEVRAAIRPSKESIQELNAIMKKAYSSSGVIDELVGPDSSSYHKPINIKPRKKPGRKPGRKPKVVEEAAPAVNGNGEHL